MPSNALLPTQPTLTPDVKDIYEIFSGFDTDGKMYWGPENLMSFMKAFNYECTHSTSFHLFNQMDMSGEGRVEFEDFFDFVTKTRQVTENMGKLRNIFYKFSKGKQFVDEQDMIRICRDNAINITEEQAKQLFFGLSPAEDPTKIDFECFERIVQMSSGDRMKGL